MPKAKLTTRSLTTTAVTTDNIPKNDGITASEIDSNFLNLRDQAWRIRADDSTLHEVSADTQVRFDGATITADANGDLTLTDLAGSGTITALNNRTADRLTTIGATTSELDGEANLTFNGSRLDITGSFRIHGSTEIDGIVDEDDQTSNSASKLVTQQSIKAYVDDKLGDAETVFVSNTVSPISTNRALHSIVKVNLDGNKTMASIQNFGTGLTMTFVFRQDSTGGRSVTFTDTIKFAGGVNTLSTAANAVDVVTIFNDGTDLLGSINKDYN